MKVPFRTIWPAALVATTLTALSATAQVQQPAADGVQAQRHEHRHEHHAAGRPDPAERAQRMQERIAEHQARLKASLQLTPAQEPAWNAFIARMQPPAAPAQPPLARDAWQQLSTPQRLERIEARQAERDRAMAQRHDAIRSFYAQLTPAQQKAFDAQAGMGLMRSGMKPGHAHPHRSAHPGPRS